MDLNMVSIENIIKATLVKLTSNRNKIPIYYEDHSSWFYRTIINTVTIKDFEVESTEFGQHEQENKLLIQFKGVNIDLDVDIVLKIFYFIPIDVTHLQIIGLNFGILLDSEQDDS